MTFKRATGLPNNLATHEWVSFFSTVTDPAGNPFVADTVIYKAGYFDNRTEEAFENGVKIYSGHFPEGFKEQSQTFTDGHAKFVKFGNDITFQMKTKREIWW